MHDRLQEIRLVCLYEDGIRKTLPFVTKSDFPVFSAVFKLPEFLVMHIFVTKSKEWNKTYRNPIYDILSMWEENRRFGRAESHNEDASPPKTGWFGSNNSIQFLCLDTVSLNKLPQSRSTPPVIILHDLPNNNTRSCFPCVFILVRNSNES